MVAAVAQAAVGMDMVVKVVRVLRDLPTAVVAVVLEITAVLASLSSVIYSSEGKDGTLCTT
jgi:hypothetical protein